MNWTEIPEFNGIDLSESYILGWSISQDTVEFELEVVLCSDHPQFHKPPTTDWACYHLGRLIFVGVHSLSGLPPQSKIFPATDTSGTADYGHLDTLSVDGNRFEISGDFGIATFTASGVKVDLVAP
jgi:hypothetical protein